MTTRSELSVLFDLFVADSAARTLLTPVMAGTGLTATQYAEYSLVLVHGPLSVTRFASIANLPLTTASDTVRSMERRAHVARVRDPADGRAWLVELTAEGRAAHQKARRAFRTAARAVREHRGPAEPAVRDALQRLAAACSAAAVSP
jgi:DNA-binding MarR family transcriptional regulator